MFNQTISPLRFCLALVLPLVVGCSGEKTESAAPEPPEEGAVAAPAIPTMLDKRQVRSGGTSITLREEQISKVKIHDVSPAAADGSHTVTVTFHHGGNRIKAKVTYEVRKTTSPSGIVIETYPVSRVETLSIEKTPRKK